jgi:preprotein translocase subunit SecF
VLVMGYQKWQVSGREFRRVGSRLLAFPISMIIYLSFRFESRVARGC